MLKQTSHPTFDKIDWNTWKPVDEATLCFVIRDAHVLLIEKKRGLGAGKINGPGGRMEPGETARDCAIRETKEELGVDVQDPQCRGRLRFQFADGYSLMAWVFVAEDLAGVAIETDEAVPCWTPVEQIPYERMWSDDILWLPDMLEGAYFIGDFHFEGDEMQGCRVECHPEAFFPLPVS